MNYSKFDASHPNQIECTNCGESFDLSLTHCPHCGINIYPLESDEQVWEENHFQRPPTQLQLLVHSAGLLLVSGLTASLISALSYIFIRRLALPQGNAVAIVIAIGSCILLGSLVGGYLAGRFARTHIKLHGILLGGINLLTLLLLLIQEFGSPSTLPLLLPTGGMSLLAGYAGAQLALRHMREELVKELFTPVLDQADLYSELVEKVRFEHDTAERLIELERQRSPKADRANLIQNAIRRWERDNR